MSREYANQKVRDNVMEVARRVKLKSEQVEKLCKVHGGYIPVDDFRLMIADAEKQLLHSAPPEKSGCFTCGIDSEVVRQVLIALLRVPDQQENIVELDLKIQTEEEVKALQRSSRDAAQISRKLASPEGAPTYEEYVGMLNKSKEPKQTEQILLSAKAGDAPLQIPSGGLLPAIEPAPKTLISEEARSVRLKILGVDEMTHVASVQVQKEVGACCVALDGLIGKTVPLEFNTKKAVRDALIGVQLISTPIACLVTIERALRQSDKKLTRLKLLNFTTDRKQQQAVLARLAQMEFDFGDPIETEEVAKDPPANA